MNAEFTVVFKDKAGCRTLSIEASIYTAKITVIEDFLKYNIVAFTYIIYFLLKKIYFILLIWFRLEFKNIQLKLLFINSY